VAARKASVFVTGRFIPACLKFVGKTGAYLWREPSVGSGFSHKYWTCRKKLARDKHSSFSCISVSDEEI